MRSMISSFIVIMFVGTILLTRLGIYEKEYFSLFDRLLQLHLMDLEVRTLKLVEFNEFYSFMIFHPSSLLIDQVIHSLNPTLLFDHLLFLLLRYSDLLG